MIDVIHGDCLLELPKLDADSLDSCCTDPPYHLTSIVKRFGKAGSAPARGNEAFKRASAGFMGKQWDGGDIAFRVETWAEVYRVLKPGAHLLAFSGTRTYHRMVCAIEDAGFEIRDQIVWMYGSGFPKSHSVSVAIDKMNGAAPRSKAFNMKGKGGREEELDENGRNFLPSYEASTEEAREWEGWGTALKPAMEPIVLARKPISEKSIAANALKHGTGALNVDACRVEGGFKSGWSSSGSKASENRAMSGPNYERGPKPNSNIGRWPANVCHDGSPEVLAEFAKYADTGTPARFFYSAKADKGDRLGSKHPTIKPVDLMRWLVRMITPPGGTVLDPFGGSGTTAMAAMAEGFNATIIELEAQSVEDIKHRIAHVKGDDTPLFEETREQTLL